MLDCRFVAHEQHGLCADHLSQSCHDPAVQERRCFIGKDSDDLPKNLGPSLIPGADVFFLFFLTPEAWWLRTTNSVFQNNSEQRYSESALKETLDEEKADRRKAEAALRRK